ncbi:MAG: UDP-N-acetylmuramoyl-L-alanyl-D-glutamate--2,6-diaminopimelate ligase [Bacteroidales bacterium]|jgi:UDP-N-acetylmuramoyl-L-alanyl-D-glutamate--2,6-diaminopimelate ligase
MYRNLNDILKGIKSEKIIGDLNKNIAEITFDSRKIVKDTLFIASKGTKSNGHDFIKMAKENGASAVVCEIIPEEINKNITYIKVVNSSKATGELASNFYDNPSSKLKLIGVTGTNGKTTIATLLFRMFRNFGHNAGLLSTVKNMINDEIFSATHTTPDAIVINQLLKQMVDEGCEYCFMEVSSHAVVQNRISGLTFAGGIFTNITHDHLDYHKTFEEYIKAKKGLFDFLPATAFALTNIDDRNGEVMLQNTAALKKTYSLKSFSDFKCKILESGLDGQLLNIDGAEVWCKLIGKFNAYNLLAIYSSAILLGKEKIEVLKELSGLSAVEGRFQYVKSENNILGIVDYAHTPDALKNVISTINEIRDGSKKLITVVGCGGDRDSKKRPIMAKIACEGSTKVILTSDNPRSEEPETIINEMQSGIDITDRKKVLTIVNRKEAIRTACHLADSGDIILVAGKGHENYQEIKGVKYPFDDLQILEEILEIKPN